MGNRLSVLAMKKMGFNMSKKSSFFWVLGVIFVLISCEKPADRTCLKMNGAYAELEISLDSVRHFHLNKNLKYRLYQDDTRKIIIKGGENLIQHIEVDNRDHVLYVDNRNKCRFLRDARENVEVEIHYPFYKTIFVDATDSVVFMNKITGDYFGVEMRNGGGSLIANVDVHEISMVVSHGAGDFNLGGKADIAELKVQNNGTGNAINFRSEYVYIYQNSTASMFIDLDGSSALIVIDGTGNVFHSNEAANIEREGQGSGQILKL